MKLINIALIVLYSIFKIIQNSQYAVISVERTMPVKWTTHSLEIQPSKRDFSKYPKIRIQSKQCSSVKCNYEVTLVKMNRDLLFMLRLMSFSEVDWKQTPVAHVLSISALRTFVVDSVLWRAVLWTV